MGKRESWRRSREMALFGDEDGDVGPFVMAEVEGGDEWFPFSLDNLEMDRACNASLQDDSRPMDQVRMCFQVSPWGRQARARLVLLQQRVHVLSSRGFYVQSRSLRTHSAPPNESGFCALLRALPISRRPQGT